MSLYKRQQKIWTKRLTHHWKSQCEHSFRFCNRRWRPSMTFSEHLPFASWRWGEMRFIHFAACNTFTLNFSKQWKIKVDLNIFEHLFDSDAWPQRQRKWKRKKRRKTQQNTCKMQHSCIELWLYSMRTYVCIRDCTCANSLRFFSSCTVFFYIQVQFVHATNTLSATCYQTGFVDLNKELEKVGTYTQIVYGEKSE